MAPNATSGNFEETRTISVGLRYPGARLPSLGQLFEKWKMVGCGLTEIWLTPGDVGLAVVRWRRRTAKKRQSIVTYRCCSVRRTKRVTEKYCSLKERKKISTNRTDS